VLSGHKGAVEKAVAVAAEKGFKKAIMLPVSAPFHSPLMAPAADVMAEALGSIALNIPAVPLVANVTAAAVRDTDTIRTLLVRQVTGLVRWRESVERLAALGGESFAELGAGKVLSGLVRRIARDAKVTAVGTPAELESFAKEL